MDFNSLPIETFAFDAACVAAGPIGTSCTLTLHLPAAAQARSPGERPMGSVVKIEVDGKPVANDTVPRAPLPIARPALLTLTF
ncbi:hypothetical protein [Ramlibacter albus]|uniref:Uncharacterized protein n=1 Tax=Ramlibacter albus TaxID=2079448 RepID=A0A923M632_9BURK|nr:hypothetical protein [Ramlibacter albus]MBC5763262.1 hypothetical protein [Ramlibacter albus]